MAPSYFLLEYLHNVFNLYPTGKMDKYIRKTKQKSNDNDIQEVTRAVK
jgi:hypothetical protein